MRICPLGDSRPDVAKEPGVLSVWTHVQSQGASRLSPHLKEGSELSLSSLGVLIINGIDVINLKGGSLLRGNEGCAPGS